MKEIRALAERWRREADALHAEVCDRGWDPVRQTFVQVYGEPQLDGALLIIPKVRFLPRSDARVRSTIAAIRRELTSAREELLYRYRSADGLQGDEGAFVACSFWLVQNLAMVGDHAEAERLFRNLLRGATPLGLLAEEIGVSRRDVRIVAGATSRQKLVVVDGVDPDDIVARWPGLRL